jgi:hypothetical protein
MSLTKHIAIGPAGALLMIELFLPPFRAIDESGVWFGLGRWPFYLRPDMAGWFVAVDWPELTLQCLAIVLFSSLAYLAASKLERVVAGEEVS